MTRTELQDIATHVLAREHRLICQWATGTGKTAVALNFIRVNPSFKTLIFVPEVDNIDNWKKEFIKFNVPIDNVTVVCYASMHKFSKSSWDFVVFDEAPHANTPLKQELFKTIKSDYVLALGAVLTDEEISALENVYGTFHKSYISIDTAIKNGWLPTPTIVVCHLSLDTVNRNQRYRGKLFTERELYDLFCSKVDKAKDAYDQRPSKLTERALNNAGLERKRFLGARKESAVSRLCNQLREKKRRFICFCSSIKQAERIGKDTAYTSKTPKSARILENFNEHKINSLFVVAKLIEGQNLTDIECGIIVQLGGTERITVQELGRVFRSENPVVYIPIFDGTKDDYFLSTLTNNVSENYIKHYKF